MPERARLSSASHVTYDDVVSLQPQDLARFLDEMLSDALAHSVKRRRQYRRGSIGLRVMTLLLGASATVILGVADLPAVADVALSLTALTTLLGALEPFFNLREIWVVQEDALWRFRQIQEELRFRVAASESRTLELDECRELFEAYEDVWTRVSRSWIGYRKQLSEPRN